MRFPSASGVPSLISDDLAGGSHAMVALSLPPALRFAVERWELRAGSPREADDLVGLAGTQARFAVIDGTPPSRSASSPLGTNGGAYAAALVRLALAEPEPALDAIRRANEALHDPARSGRDQHSAAVVVASVDRHQTEIVAAGDGLAFVRRGGFWSQVGDGRMLTTSAEQAWREALADRRSDDADARIALERTLHAEAADWLMTPVGRFAELGYQRTTFENDWEELVLASAGARLDASLLDDVRGWLAGLRRWEQANAGRLAGQPMPVF